MSARNENKPKPEEMSGDTEGLASPLTLENIFEDVGSIFLPNEVGKASSRDVLIAVDTNVLLLPLTIGSDALSKLQAFYERLRAEERLFLPARAAREYISNRDRKFADLLKTLNDMKSRVNQDTKLPPILDTEDYAAAEKVLAKAKSDYIKALARLGETVRSWNGDDPVTKVYAAAFDRNNIISPEQELSQVLLEWKTRRAEQRPPGYKDASKPDTGVGDFLIWKSLLDLAEMKKKDMIFITGDEKADWSVRVDGKGVFPRPELIAEYRKASGGKSIRFANLHDVLREMDVAEEVVSEVEAAEQIANISSWSGAGKRIGASKVFIMDGGKGEFVFDREHVLFDLKSTLGTSDFVWIYPINDFALTFSKYNGLPGTVVQIGGLARLEKPFPLSVGETLYVRDNYGHTLLARLLSVSHFSDVNVKIDFEYAIHIGEEEVYAP
ncbi:PIN domain-containing protein [Rhizobium brockwellii]|uniref:PIN domain-containing protein n=1 Tax=Rhizobium brockwellii TaxID=3019932 RepID=UPI003F9720EA